MMKLSELRYLVTLAQKKHFGKAADACCIAQPTLSVAISNLESRLGVTIFERHHNNISITNLGQEIVAQAQRVLEEVAIIEALAKSGQSQLETPLKVGSIYTIAPYLFPLLVPKLKKIAPNMPLVIQENFTAKLKTQLQQGELDAAFVALPFTSPGVVTMPLYDEPFVILMKKDHPLANKKTIKEKDLLNEKILLLGEGHCFRDQILESCPYCFNKNENQQTVEGTSLETIRHMVASGLGITVLPNTATQVKHYQSILCTKPFNTKAPQRTVALAWRASFPRTKAIDAIVKAISNCKLKN